MAYLRESSQRQRQQINQRPYGSFNAWLLGSSVASLATAVYLIRDADVPPSSIHVIESRRTPEDGLAITGDPVNGYDHRGACMPSLSDQCIEDLLAPVHSAMVAETTSTENVDKRQTVGGSTKLLIQKNNDLEIIHPRNIGVSLRVRAQLAVFMLWPEHSLGRKTISQCFGKGFFNSKLWAIWSTLFGFCPWHSAVEFRRCICTHFRAFQSSNTFSLLDRCRYTPYEDIVGPITHFLENQGVDFQFNCKVTDVAVSSTSNCGLVSAFRFIQNGSENIVSVGPCDFVIVSPGSVMSGSTRGTNTKPPSLKLLDAEDNLDGNWSLWLGISPSFGDPYNFCTRVSESRLEAFTITVNGVETFNHFKNLAQIDSNSSGVILLRHSNWLLNLYIPHQPLIPHQPDGVKILWGFGSIPNCEGNFVRKSMLRCSGQEIMIETLQHLDLPLESILPNVTTIPRIMPRLTAPLLSRACRDRPKITSQSTANLAAIGQFVEISGRTCATMDYSVRGAKEAVSSVVSFRKELAKANKTLDA